MKYSRAFAVGLFLLAAFLVGCGGSSSSKGKQTGPLTIDPSELPKLGEYMPPMDDGRVQIAPPAKWDILPRANKYLARFQPSDESEYPIVLVSAKDCEEVFNIAPENVTKFAGVVKRIESVPQVRPVAIGKFQGVSYRKRAKEKESINRIVERLIVDTVVAGRRYSIELRSRGESLRDNQQYLFAVAHGIKFLKLEGTVAAPVSEAPAGEDAPAAKAEPAAEPSAEAKPEPAAEPKVEPKAEPKVEAKPQPKAETKPEPKPEPKVTPKPQPKPEAKKPAAKPAKDEGLDGLDDLLK